LSSKHGLLQYKRKLKFPGITAGQAIEIEMIVEVEKQELPEREEGWESRWNSDELL